MIVNNLTYYLSIINQTPSKRDMGKGLIQLKSQRNCQLAIGKYPIFQYDARGGGGSGSIIYSEQNQTILFNFNPKKFSIPELNWRTTKILGLPLLPCFQIKILPEQCKGIVNRENGEIELQFKSKFLFSLFSIFQFPKLSIEASLTTGLIESQLHKAKGHPLSSNNLASLVGVAVVPKCGNAVLDAFLDLPNEALAILNCEIIVNY